MYILTQALARHCGGWYYYYCSLVKVGLDQPDSIADESLCPLGNHRHSDGLIKCKRKNGPSLRKPSASKETADALDFPFITSCGEAGGPRVWDSGRDIWKS